MVITPMLELRKMDSKFFDFDIGFHVSFSLNLGTVEPSHKTFCFDKVTAFCLCNKVVDKQHIAD